MDVNVVCLSQGEGSLTCGSPSGFIFCPCADCKALVCDVCLSYVVNRPPSVYVNGLCFCCTWPAIPGLQTVQQHCNIQVKTITDGVFLNLKEKLILEKKVEGTRPLKALPPVIWGGHIGFEKLVYIRSVCEKCTTDTHEKFRGKWKTD